MTNTTNSQFDSVIAKCREVFMAKMDDYGTAWRILRPSSLTDQIFIKASRIRSIENKGASKVEEGILPEFMGIVNYSIMALIQLEEESRDREQSGNLKTEVLYDEYAGKAKSLMLNKNHDYGEAWRSMRVSSLTDIILMKLLRIKQIEDNQGITKISEGLDANYYDIINYAIFALIRLTEA
jgi:hypothetical protein